MNPANFDLQIKRLDDRWPGKFPAVLKLVIWDEVKGLSDEDFRKIVTKLIGEEAHPPLVPKFREAISEIRERAYEGQKRIQSQDAQDYWSSRFHQEEQKEIFSQIHRRMNKEMSDDDWEKFMKTLKASSN